MLGESLFWFRVYRVVVRWSEGSNMSLYQHHSHQPQPHISAAVKHLRGWITILAVLVAICCVGQMLIYGFVRFTEIRFTEASRPAVTVERPRQERCRHGARHL